jgi:phosphoglycolate phosphatase
MNLLFDLDGTLTDSAPGITRCLQHALTALGREAPPADRLRKHVGRDIRQVLAELLAAGDDALIESAVARYRERFTTIGIFENALYPDVLETMADLTEAGHRLWVVTAKPEIFARRVVEHFGLARFFEKVYGAELSGRNVDKTELLAEVLEREALDPAASWMIGDRAGLPGRLDACAGGAPQPPTSVRSSRSIAAMYDPSKPSCTRFGVAGWRWEVGGREKSWARPCGRLQGRVGQPDDFIALRDLSAGSVGARCFTGFGLVTR